MRGARTLTDSTSRSRARRPRLLCSAGLVVCALALPLAADEPTPTPSAAPSPAGPQPKSPAGPQPKSPAGPQPKIPAPLRVLKDFDPALARKSHFGIYLRTQRVVHDPDQGGPR